MSFLVYILVGVFSAIKNPPRFNTFSSSDALAVNLDGPAADASEDDQAKDYTSFPRLLKHLFLDLQDYMYMHTIAVGKKTQVIETVTVFVFDSLNLFHF